MQWTLCYSLMTACLGSVLAYSVYTGAFAKENPTDAFDAAFASLHEPSSACLADEKVPSVSADASDTAADGRLTIGATRQQVRNLLGEPLMASDDDSRWTYGSNTLVFQDDRVAGYIKTDPDKVRENAMSELAKSLAASKTSDRSMSRASKSGKFTRSTAHRRSVSHTLRRYSNSRPFPFVRKNFYKSFTEISGLRFSTNRHSRYMATSRWHAGSRSNHYGSSGRPSRVIRRTSR